MIIAMSFGLIMNSAAQVKTSDSTFIKKSRPIEFIVNKTFINEEDKRWITDSLIPALKALGDRGVVLGRATASPEGPYLNNVMLANKRRASMDYLLSSFGIDTNRIIYDVVPEDYQLLCTMMEMRHDPKLQTVNALIARYGHNSERLKVMMMKHDGGKLWKYILHTYFPRLRAVRIMAIDRREVIRNEVLDMSKEPMAQVDYKIETEIGRPNLHVDIPHFETQRRELLSVKTNLLFDFAYMPGYDRFCPIPNVAIEYYPLHGHFTYGASFDGPWWQHYDEHKYFQLRNYQLHTRYYLRSGDISLRKPGKGAAFKGLFFSAYANANLYNICFDEHRGWEGEGWGAGLGIGYVLPLGGKEHWRLEFGLQAGFYQTDYDPYQWRCPVNPDTDPVKYYYKWYGDAKDFKKRQHRYTWLGPTRLEVTLSYDLLYRKVKR